MSTAFFAARKLHKDYFEKLTYQLDDGSQVLWYKSLSSPQWSAKPSKQSLNSLIDDHIREKQNSLKGRSRSATYWKFFSAIKKLEAKWLFKVYFNALKTSQCQQMLIWNGLKYRQRIAVAAAQSLQMPIVYMENGLIPGMTTIDAQGINYLNSAPRSKDFYINREKSDSYSTLANQLKEQIKAKPASLPEHYIFIPFQVNTDSQVILFSPWIKDMFEMTSIFEQVSQHLGEQSPVFLFKTHPACDEAYTDLINQYQNHEYIQFYTDSEATTLELINYSDSVITINSTVGIESLLLGKKVCTLGQAFYSIQDICLYADSIESLITNIEKLSNWQLDSEAISGLFNYLIDTYQINGRWQDSFQEHIQLTCNRIQEIEAQSNESV